MEDTIFRTVLQQMKHYLRDRRQESYYETARQSKLRIDIVKRIEEDNPKGSSESLIRYMDSFCNRFPIEGKRILYAAVMMTAQQPMIPQ